MIVILKLKITSGDFLDLAQKCLCIDFLVLQKASQ